MAFAYDVIFMVGSQGSGKGTQGKRLAERLNFFFWDMGAVLRGIAAEATPFGGKIGAIMKAGNLLEDEIIIDVLKEHLPSLPYERGFVFDGVPRRMGQAKYLLESLKAEGKSSMATLTIEVPRDVCVQRIMGRASVENRADDTPQAINARLDAYDAVTRPMLEYLKKETAYFEIDGRPGADEVEKEIDRALGL